MENRQRRQEASKSLPDDMEAIKAELARLKEHTGLEDEEEDKAESIDGDEA